MSLRISLYYEDDRNIKVEKHFAGNTVEIGGSESSGMDINYGYCRYYFLHLDEEEGIRYLHGKTAQDCLAKMRQAVEILGTERSASYWDASPGNAGYALSAMLSWAEQNPEAIFHVM